MIAKKVIHLIAAARPNFMKIAPLYHALKKESRADPVIVHTGQHYDLNMSDAFFADLGLPEPHVHLGVGSGTHAEQTGKVMMAYEKLIIERRPDLTVVVGDVNSTAAATLAAVKLGIKTAHLEAGLRSFDRGMPEEINRVVTDALADLLWTPSPDADENLLREGVPAARIERVGNILIDSLEMLRARIEREDAAARYGMKSGGFGLVTLHRPSNVDDPPTLAELCAVLTQISQRLALIFPVHPRTRKNLESFGLLAGLQSAAGVHLEEPLSYIAFMSLLFGCRLAITDSGGIQEETTYLGIPCLTLRPNTERPVTVSQGTNRLCPIDHVEAHVAQVLDHPPRTRQVPELWDGRTAHRVVESIRRFLSI
jgi:UDP-N-acetylglucosamine 2-epimerase (non-hydrolysing)